MRNQFLILFLGLTAIPHVPLEIQVDRRRLEDDQPGMKKCLGWSLILFHFPGHWKDCPLLRKKSCDRDCLFISRSSVFRNVQDLERETRDPERYERSIHSVHRLASSLSGWYPGNLLSTNGWELAVFTLRCCRLMISDFEAVTCQPLIRSPTWLTLRFH